MDNVKNTKKMDTKNIKIKVPSFEGTKNEIKPAQEALQPAAPPAEHDPFGSGA